MHLIEDRPSPNVTSPGSVPIDLSIPSLTITRDKSGLFSIQPSEYTTNVDVHADLAKSSAVATSKGKATGGDSKTMTQHLDLVRSGVASIETELEQKASLLAVDNANLRSMLENANLELVALRRRLTDNEEKLKRTSRLQAGAAALDKENKSLKQTLKYLQQELVKAGKKV